MLQINYTMVVWTDAVGKSMIKGLATYWSVSRGQEPIE